MKNLKTYLILLILLAILSISGMFFSLILLLNDKLLISAIFLLVSIGITVLLVKLKNDFDYLRHTTLLNDLINNKNSSYILKNAILDKKFYQRITGSHNYKRFEDNDNYSLYYKIDFGITKIKRNRILFVILVLKDNTSFIDSKMNAVFSKLERSFTKKDYYNKRIFYQFKEAKAPFSDEVINDADQIFFLTTKDDDIAIINVLYSSEKGEVYYLNADDVRKPYILTLAYENLNKIMK